MPEVSIKTKRDQESTIYGDMKDVGVHAYIDKDYYERRDEIEKYFGVDEKDIEALKLSPTREFLLRRTYKVLGFVNSQGAAGRGGDNIRFYRAMGAARNLCQRNIEDLLYCQAADDEVGLVCLDRLACVEKLPMATFRKDNSTVQKAFTVQGMPNQNRGFEGQILDEDTAEALMKLKDDQWRQKHGK